jgi:hypothetical protein
MSLQWISKSRYGDVRTFIYDAEKQEICMSCKDVCYTSYSTGQKNEVVAIDPDGGPYLGVGGFIYTEPSGPIFRILRILFHSQIKQNLKVIFSVQKKEQ